MNDLIVANKKELVDAQDFYFRLDAVMEKALATKDVELVLNEGVRLIQIGQLTGMGLAKLAFELKKVWREFGVGATFEDTIMQYWSMEKVTLNRYMQIWEMRVALQEQGISQEIREALEEKTLDEQVKISIAWASGFPMDETVLQKLADAESPAEVYDMVRDIKNEEPRKNSLNIRLTRDGSLYAYAGQDSNGLYVGYLDIDSNDDTIKKAINRILNSCRIRQD